MFGLFSFWWLKTNMLLLFGVDANLCRVYVQLSFERGVSMPAVTFSVFAKASSAVRKHVGSVAIG